MIIENKTPPDESIPLDAPPSYDDVRQGSGNVIRGNFNDEKDRSFLTNRRSEPMVTGPTTLTSNQFSQSAYSQSSTSSSWFNVGVFGASSSQPSPSSARSSAILLPPTPKSQVDVRATVQELVRDLVTSAPTDGTSWADNVSTSFGVLDSCAAACVRQHVSLSSVLQERSIEGHTPLYWAIVKRPARPLSLRQSMLDHESQLLDEDAVIWKILSLSAPLTSYTLSEMRLACLATHSNDLLQRLRRSPIAFPLSGTEKMLLSGSSSGQLRNPRGFMGAVEVVEDATADGAIDDTLPVLDGRRSPNKKAGLNGEGGFMVRIELEMFQRRMSVSGSVVIEFIARGRLWQLTFFVVPSLYPYLSVTPPSASEEPRVPYAAISSLRALTDPPAPGMWACCLTTAPGSPQCWLDSRIVVKHPSVAENIKPPLTLRLRTTSSPLQAQEPPPYTPIPLSLDSSGSSSPSFPLFGSFLNPVEANVSKADKHALSQARKLGKSRAEREKRLKQSWEWPEDSESRKSEENSVIVEVLEESGMGKLMYDQCPYIASDGILRATFEAQLSHQKPETDRPECIIC